MYDYKEEIKNDVLDYIKNEVDFNDFEDLEELGKFLNDELFINDSVTGNASGSYTFSTYEAEKNICHNLDLLGEALEEFGSSPADILSKGAEAADVIIRCYLLGECIAEALTEIKEEFEESKEGEE